MILSSSLVKPALLEVFTIESPKLLGQYAVEHNVVNYVFRSLMMTNICYTTFMANVKIAYAKAHLPELLERVAQGERIVISRYNTPMAELVPAPKAEKVQRKFGTGKGKAMLIDPRALDPMTDDEAEAFLQGRY